MEECLIILVNLLNSLLSACWVSLTLLSESRFAMRCERPLEVDSDCNKRPTIVLIPSLLSTRQ